MVDSGTAIQYAEYFASLAMGMEVERKVEEMIEGKQGHFWTKGYWRLTRHRMITYHDQSIALLEPREPAATR